MSWIVERLIKDRQRIRTSLQEDEDAFDMLISLEKGINELIEAERLSKEEIEIINKLSTGGTVTQISKDLEMSRTTLLSKLKKICDRIAFHLGGEFTDEGFLEYFSQKHRLNEEEVRKAMQYLDKELI